MDNEQTAKQTPADVERLKELFEYEMTQVRAGFRKELLQLNAEKTGDAGKDVSVPEIKAVETPAYQTDPVTLTFDCPDISAELANAGKTAETRVQILEVQMPEPPQNSRVQAAAGAEAAVPQKPELSLPAAAVLDAVQKAGAYRSGQDAGSISAELDQKLNRNALQGALSALDSHKLAEPTEISLPEKISVSLGDIGMDRLNVWEGAQPAVSVEPDLTVPALNPQRYGTKAVQAGISEAIPVPDTAMSKIAGWESAEIPAVKVAVDVPDIPEIGSIQQAPTLPVPEKITAEVPDVSVKAKFPVPQIAATPEKISVPEADTLSVQNWKPAEPKTAQASVQAGHIDSIKAPEMPVPPVIAVSSAGITLPNPIEPKHIAASGVTESAELNKAAAPVLPEIPDITGLAVSGEIKPQNAEFGQIQTGMQQVLADAARTLTEGTTLAAGLLHTANG